MSRGGGIRHALKIMFFWGRKEYFWKNSLIYFSIVGTFKKIINPFLFSRPFGSVLTKKIVIQLDYSKHTGVDFTFT